MLARSKDELDQAVGVIGRGARAFPVDVTDAAGVANAFREIGQVDLLVNNAGIVQPIGPFAESDFDAWGRAIEVNVRGAMICTHAVLPAIIERGHGRVVNLVTGAFSAPHLSAYCASKTALVRATERPASLLMAVASGCYDALAGFFLTPFDDLDAMLPDHAAIAGGKFHSLQIRSLRMTGQAAAAGSIRNSATS